MNLITRIKLVCETLVQRGQKPAELHIHPAQWTRLKRQLLPESLAERNKTKKSKPVTTIDVGCELVVDTDPKYSAVYVATDSGAEFRA